MPNVAGSLDAPPVVVTSSRTKTVLGMLGCLVFVALGVWIAGSHDPSPKAVIGGPLAIVFFGGIFALLAFRLVRPMRLELSPAGLVYLGATGRRTEHRWRDVSGFRVWTYRSARCVVFDVAQGPGAGGGLTGLNRAISGADTALPSGWTLPADRLAALLQEAKARWG